MEWEKEDVYMNQVSYYSTLNEIKKEGIEGKTFLEAGCGPCPLGPKLLAMGAKKIYALDFCQNMLNNAKEELTKEGVVDKFEFI